METMYYIGLDVHKKTIGYGVKDSSGRIYAEGTIPATRLDLDMYGANGQRIALAHVIQGYRRMVCL